MLAAEHPESERLAALCSQEAADSRAHLTRSSRQLTIDCIREGPAAELWKEAGIGETMFSMRPLDSGGISTVGIHRPAGTADFTARELRIAHILLTESGWLHESGWSDGPLMDAPKLSPRRRMVLDLVLEGRSRKDMAQELGISVHTLDGYVKDIFRQFNAHSQAELIARFRSGDGRDAPPRSGD
jgi:DNA-binding CsgD family transcriptional regulator